MQHLACVFARLAGDFRPPSMRASSSARSSMVSSEIVVRVVFPSVSLETRRW
jgi:hypothetical protein